MLLDLLDTLDMGSISWSAALVHLHRNKEVLESFLMLLYAF